MLNRQNNGARLRVLSTALACAISLGCGGQNQDAKSPIGTSEDVDQSEHDSGPEWTPPTAAEDAVEKAARHFTGYRAQDQLELNEEELFTFMASADAVCVGERHNSALDHYAELRTLEALAERRGMRGFELGFAMEMVKKGAQYELSEYLGGRMSRDQFVEKTNWEKSWGFPIQYYDPQMVMAKSAGISGIALGFPQDISHHIAERGLGGLSDSDLRQVPDLDLDNQQHRQLFDSLMGNHPLPKGAKLDHYYQAQVVWDEAMAKTSRQWLMEHRPMRKLVIFAGVAHCHRAAIPSRLERGTDLVVVNMISTEGKPERSDGSDPMIDGYEYQIVFE